MKNDLFGTLSSNFNEIDTYLNNVMNPKFRSEQKKERLKRKMGKELKRNLPW